MRTALVAAFLAATLTFAVSSGAAPRSTLSCGAVAGKPPPRTALNPGLLAAKVVFIGRAYLYGFAVGGQAGVERVLDVFRAEISRTMTLLGCQRVADLDRSWLDLSWLDPGRLQRPAPG